MLIVYVVSCFLPDAKYRVKLKPPIPTFQNDRYNIVVYFQNLCNFRSSTVYQPLRASMGVQYAPPTSAQSRLRVYYKPAQRW